MPLDHDTFQAELASLRRQVRLLLALLVCSVLLAASSLGLALRPDPRQQSEDADVLVGRSLYLRQNPDEPYVRLKYLLDGAGLILADSEGRGQAQLTAVATGGRLALGSAPPRVMLDAAVAGPSLTLRDGQGNTRILLSAGEMSRLALLDEKGRVRLELSAGANGGRLRLLGKRGEVEFEAPSAARRQPVGEGR